MTLNDTALLGVSEIPHLKTPPPQPFVIFVGFLCLLYGKEGLWDEVEEELGLGSE